MLKELNLLNLLCIQYGKSNGILVCTAVSEHSFCSDGSFVNLKEIIRHFLP